MQHLLLFLFIAEVSYIFVGVDLLRRSTKTHGLPELFLGLAFVFNGLSYFFTDLPIVTGYEAFVNEFSYIGRIFASACALTVAAFSWRVFRSEAGWAKTLFWVIGATLVLGLSVAAIEGDWEGAHPLTYKGFWFEWVGGLIPFCWLAAESLRTYIMTRRRVKIGLSDPVVCNRFFLIGLYGTLATLTYPLYLWMYILYERYGTWSDALSVFAGCVEVISLVALWISFAAPPFYQRWVGNSQADA
jgi:hypothetical protein